MCQVAGLNSEFDTGLVCRQQPISKPESQFEENVYQYLKIKSKLEKWFSLLEPLSKS